MKTLDQTYQEVCEKLTMELPFGFSRFGDGEWNCIFGKSGHNCDKHEYFDDLGDRLRSIVSGKPRYMVGIQELALRGPYGEEVARIVEGSGLEWFNADVLHKMSIYGRLGDFFRAIRNRHIILVGPSYLTSLPLGIKYQINVPEINCWLEYPSIRETLEDSILPGDLVLVCAGMMANVLVDDFQDKGITIMDVGSVLDPYAGKITRAYHKQLEL